MNKSEKIIKLRWQKNVFDFCLNKITYKEVTVINADGTVICKGYSSGSKSADYIDTGKCSQEDYKSLCSEIRQCIESADRLYHITDDCSANLKIFHPFERVQTVNRGLGNEKVSLDRIMEEFLYNSVSYDDDEE